MEFLRPTKTALRSIDDEVGDKVTDLLESSDRAKKNLLKVCDEHLQSADLVGIKKALEYAETLPSNDPNHPAMSAYFAHPLRVANFIVRLSAAPTTETVVMGLIHNVFEVSGLTEVDLISAGFTAHQADGIRLLTVDRARQYDPDYLATFYRNIESFGEDLVLVRCVDRLDNLLGFDVIPRTEKLAMYLSLTERFVIPMATRLSNDFGQYLSDVLTRMQNSSCVDDLRFQYESFMKQPVKTDEQ
jgi:(p)ppGpp synthase/HD superfamily hydrolase